MKIAFYMEEGKEQIVLTPQNDFEKSMLSKITDGSRAMSIKTGSFYECRGGWTRNGSGDDSTIIVLAAKAVEEAS